MISGAFYAELISAKRRIMFKNYFLVAILPTVLNVLLKRKTWISGTVHGECLSVEVNADTGAISFYAAVFF